MKIICIGRNYAAHIKELNGDITEKPVIFLKPDTALIPKHNTFFYPNFSKNIHYEAEVVIKICRLGKNIEGKFAHRYFNELTVGIDFTARDLQEECSHKGNPWEISKSFDFSAPVGNFIHKSFFENVYSLDFGLKINENWVQQANTSEMIYSFDKIIAYISAYFTLKTGDLIFTGTPVGVGSVQKNDHLKAFLGNQMVLELDVK